VIYFLRCEEDFQDLKAGWIKIGTTIRLADRLKQIAAEIGHTPMVLAILDGAFAEERALHELFKESREIGEWFQPHEELLQLITNEGRPWNIEDDASVPESITISIKTTVKFRDWLAKIGAAERNTIVQILEKGAVEYGEKRGFKDAPRRTSR
jgi:hypothetical protein